jgi:hypothetical protein
MRSTQGALRPSWRDLISLKYRVGNEIIRTLMNGNIAQLYIYLNIFLQ